MSSLDLSGSGLHASRLIAFIPIYPNTLPTVPKLSRASRMMSLVFSELPASQGAITRLQSWIWF
jgi:hypothetical protein